ncbi:FAD-dependent oxidoreductase [Lactobacillus sp. HT06-2]|uniref:FAD-dependent oxidoreductase n=1 Tax=Lactobacillus sp. HT06-2 TaxID=2080222 RepID=UPI000CD87706|nr:FAD-dependent oxidoreductase [Lactobacillus sp. HT06-2]
MSLKDGNYNVVAKGYLKDRVPLTITIKNHKIAKITPKVAFSKGGLQDTVYTQLSNQIIAQQNTDVDAISGATYSSHGLREAVNQVLQEAGQNDVKKVAAKEVPNQDWLVEAVKPHDDDYSEWRAVPKKIDQTYDTDFLIIGGGISGLAAAVQAGEDHMNVTVIDKNDFVAGNGGGVEGIFGINSSMQKKAGIHADPEKIISQEMKLAQYRPDGSFWVDLVNNSAANIEWLLKQGVQLTKVDDYHGTCQFPTFHWFKGGVAATGYVPYMKKRADELGVNFILGTKATSIIYEDGRVKGIYAKNKDGNLKINAKAVLLATGGVGHNASLIAKQGWQTKNLHFLSMPSTTGDGYQMAMSVGAKDMLQESPEFMMNYIQALPMHRLANLSNDPISGLRSVPAGFSAIFVNQNGRRFVNENISKLNLLNQRMPIKSVKAAYEIFTKDIYLKITQSLPDADPEAEKILEESVKTNRGNSLYKEDTIEALAKDFDLPVDNLVKTIQNYNKYCHNGRDEEFNKDQSQLVAMDQGPYYIARLDPSNLIGVGGIGSNNDFEVIDDDFNKIPGLYVSGMDSTMQYRNVYTITLGGSACSHNVNSGRHAAMNAKKYIATL